MLRLDPCAASHGPISPVEALLILRALFAVGVSHHSIADLTRLDLSHAQARQLFTRPTLIDQAHYLAEIVR